ncbi:MAG: hypothetical protein MUD16_03135 [Desulfobacterales bacterium]|jgi:hypothetical protein|nr:hypothetical protein [Desulfobacterales bacterium]
MRAIAITLLCVVCLGSGFRAGGLAAPDSGRASYAAQTNTGPEKAGQKPQEAAPPPSRGKGPGEAGREQPPAAPPKSEPLKPFEPTEKVQADQAIDFPADI